MSDLAAFELLINESMKQLNKALEELVKLFDKLCLSYKRVTNLNKTFIEK